MGKQVTIRRKILLGYILFALVGIAAILVLYQGITQIVILHSEPSAPNSKLKQINKLLGSIYESENFSRSYFLFRKKEDLLFYINASDKIEAEIKTFHTFCKGNKSQEIYMQEINHLLAEKRAISLQLINFNLDSKKDSIYQNTVNEIYKTTYNQFNKPVVVKRTLVVKHDSVYQSPKKVSLFQRLKNVFVSSKEKNSLTKVNIERSEQLDTINPYKPTHETVVSSVQSSFDTLRKKEADLLNEKNNNELILLSNDRAILERIRSIISLIETEELHYTNASLLANKQIIKQSMWIITGLSVLALILMAFFMVIISRDIARSNAYQKALKEARLQAESLLKLKEQFVANISHEIRTPLSAITGLSEQLQKTNDADEKNVYASHIVNATNHLHQLVNQVLDLSKAQAGMLNLENITFNINSIINEVYSLFLNQANAKSIILNVTILNKDNLQLMGDPFRIRQILLNLVGNALKFTDKGHIDLQCQVNQINDTDVMLQLIVSDTGIGIPADKYESIFEEFTQAEQNTTRNYGGTGLGLAIVRKLTEAMNGNVHVKSELGLGSSFIVSIPLKIVENQNTVSVEQIPTVSFNHIKLLFVEDDETLRLLISKIMANHLILCTLAPNAEEALEFLNKDDFDIIFTDIQMPGMNGFELVAEIRKTQKTIPIVALTARNENVEIFVKQGFTDALAKPYKEEDLLQKISCFMPESNISHSIVNEENLSDQSFSLLFNTNSLLKFVANDKSALLDILRTFNRNTRIDIDEVQKAILLTDAQAIAAKAHKMMSMFKQLEINSLIETLDLLEHNIALELPFADVALLADNLCIRTNLILIGIDEYIAELAVNE